jgi:S1-C subfamily serine protease
VNTFREDRTGAKAFELTFEKPIAEIERDWKRWIADQPEIDLLIRSDDAALGIRSRENSSNDGVVIQEVIPGSAAAEAGLRKGDIIVAIDDQSTRSLMDLRKIIAVKDIGEVVEVRGRRNGEYFKMKVTLRPAVGTS